MRNGTAAPHNTLSDGKGTEKIVDGQGKGGENVDNGATGRTTQEETVAGRTTQEKSVGELRDESINSYRKLREAEETLNAASERKEDTSALRERNYSP